MATREIAEAAARSAAIVRQRDVHVINDPSVHDLHKALAYYCADDDDLETFFVGCQPLTTFGPDGRREG